MFNFGENWLSYIETLDDDKIKSAEFSLNDLSGKEDFTGYSFLDAGSGSGLFSLAAKKLGAARVVSFDLSKESVLSTQTLKEKYYPEDEFWEIDKGSVLDKNFLSELGEFDIVYSWGVLHHTGNMWRACNNIAQNVKTGGMLIIAIYNDQGIASHVWKLIKKVYNFFPQIFKKFYAYFIIGIMELKHILGSLILNRKRESKRGMNWYHDWIDWIGGYPFEVATRESIVKFYESRGFKLLKLKENYGYGNNEFCFIKQSD